MIEIVNGSIKIKVSDYKASYDSDGIDTSSDILYSFDTKYKFSSVFKIEVFEQSNLIRNIFIASDNGATGVHETSMIIDNDKLVICCSNIVFCISIPSLELLWKTEVDNFTCFQIFKVNETYIVHGELEISCLDTSGNILWQHGGADIFVTMEGVNDFKIMDNLIIAKDWNYKEYKFDFDGNIIS